MAHIATIQFYRGAESGLPVLADGEPGWTTDTHKLFIGQAGVNFEITGGGGTGTGTADCCYSDEMAQDAIGGILVNSSSVGFTYTDGTPAITASVINGSITYAKLSASGATTGQMLIYNGSGLAWSTPATSYTNEEAQDAVGDILTDSSTIDFTYDDITPSITAIVKDNSVTLAKISTSGATTGYVIGYDGANIIWTPNGDTGTGTTGGSSYTDEQAQDAIGGILVDSPTIDFTYNDGVPSITASIVADSIQGSHIMDGTIDNSDLANNCIASNNLQTGCVTLSKISTTGATTGYVIGYDGANIVWMSNGDTGTGTTGGSSYTDEQAQDAVGTILDSGSNGQVALSYDDSTPAITANLSARGFAAIMARISMRG